MRSKLFVFLLLLLLLSVPAYSENERPESVTISYIEHIPPFWFRDADGNLQGIGPDYWRLWGEKTGIKVDFLITTWPGSLEAVQKGYADFHSGMVPSAERKHLFDFAEHQTVMTEEFLFVRSDLDVKSPADLNKAPIWTDGGISEKLLKDRFDGLTLVNADSYDVINQQIKNRTMTAFVMDEHIAAYNLAKLDAAGRYKKVYSVYNQPLFAAVKKGNSHLLRFIDEGHSQISADEFSAIYSKYIASKIQYPEWFEKLLVTVFLAMLFGFFVIYSLLAKYQIGRKTKQLQEALDTEHKLRMEKERLLVHKSRLAQLGEMINSVTHQWKQPLNVINMVAEGMKDIEYDETVDKKQIVRDAGAITEQVRFMVNTMDDFSGFTSPAERISYFDVCDACKDGLRLMEHTINFNKVKTEIVCDDNLTIKGAKNDFVHIVINLLTNSMDAFISRNIKDGSVSFRASRMKNGDIQIKYTDNAGGLQGIDINEIFEPYLSTKKDDSGTGIGLYLTRNILRKSFKGDIRAENNSDGLSFYIELKS